MPTSKAPLLPTERRLAKVVALVEEAMAKIVWLTSPLLAWIESFEYGDVVPIPTFPPRNVAAGPVPDCVTANVGMEAVLEAKSPPWNHAGVVEAIVVVPYVVAKEPPHAV